MQYENAIFSMQYELHSGCAVCSMSMQYEYAVWQ
jgi:hypothetical protein